MSLQRETGAPGSGGREVILTETDILIVLPWQLKQQRFVRSVASRF